MMDARRAASSFLFLIRSETPHLEMRNGRQTPRADTESFPDGFLLSSVVSTPPFGAEVPQVLLTLPPNQQKIHPLLNKSTSAGVCGVLFLCLEVWGTSTLGSLFLTLTALGVVSQ